MGKRGPAPRPTALLEAAGSTQVYKRTEEPVAGDLGLEAPSILTGNALAAWNNLRPRITWLKCTDENILVRYCHAWARWQALSFVVSDSVFDDQEGIAAQYAKTCELLIRMEAQLGLTPSARSQVKVAPKPKANDAKLRLLKKA